jgi:hypothetical protein
MTLARCDRGEILTRMNACNDCGLEVPKIEGDGKSTVPYGWRLIPPTEGDVSTSRWYCPTCWAAAKARDAARVKT